MNTSAQMLRELIEECDDLRKQVQELREVVALTVQHFDGTDAPLGKQARAALEHTKGE